MKITTWVPQMMHIGLSDEPTLFSVLAVEALNGTVMRLGPNFRHVSMEVCHASLHRELPV